MLALHSHDSRGGMVREMQETCSYCLQNRGVSSLWDLGTFGHRRRQDHGQRIEISEYLCLFRFDDCYENRSIAACGFRFRGVHPVRKATEAIHKDNQDIGENRRGVGGMV